MWLLCALAAPLLFQSLASLRGGFRYLGFFRRELSREPADFAPRASVFVPCRGVEQGLRENLSALFRQDYPAYELVFVVDDAGDPALGVVEAARQDSAHGAGVTSRVVVAGRARDCGQKVHNLRAAVRGAGRACEVFVFVDTDARARRDWLRSLVAPLADERAGAATGYRWFVPSPRGGLSSHLRAVWNASIASALGENARRNFCWGGSTAIRRATFDRLNILGEWRGALSDDYAVTRALQRAALPIAFVPACLVASHDDCSARELFEFTTRQLKITRTYAPRLWLVVLVSNLVFCAGFYGALALAAARALRGESFALPLALAASVFLIGATKAALRLRAVNLVLAREGSRVGGVARLAQLTLWTVTGALFLWNAAAASFSRRITWRGITYEMKSPTRTRVVRRGEAPSRRG
ncbi:MAG: glycosyltransferase [Acidobacteria bacterium]|nr:glycosyltransferase [Acidobacteriota bacterium]